MDISIIWKVNNWINLGKSLLGFAVAAIRLYMRIRELCQPRQDQRARTDAGGKGPPYLLGLIAELLLIAFTVVLAVALGTAAYTGFTAASEPIRRNYGGIEEHLQSIDNSISTVEGELERADARLATLVAVASTPDPVSLEAYADCQQELGAASATAEALETEVSGVPSQGEARPLPWWQTLLLILVFLGVAVPLVDQWAKRRRWW